MRRHALLALAIVACTDGGLGDVNFRGAPLARLPMLLFEPPPAENVALAVFWADRIIDVQASGQFFEQRGSAFHVDPEATIFELPLYEPPPADMILTSPQGARMAAGFVAGYVDANANLRHDPGERLIGNVDPLILVYLPEAVPRDRSPSGLALDAGFHALHGPLMCAPFPAVTPGDCGVPLGEFCTSDADCGAGTCKLEFGLDQRMNGACVVVEPPADGCRPADGTLRLRRRTSPDGVIGEHFLRCHADADCLRADGERTIHCVTSSGLCRAAAHWAVKFESSLPSETFCIDE